MSVYYITAGAVLLFASLTTAVSELHPLSDEFIALINSKQNSWRAGRNFAADTSMEYIKGLMGVIKSEQPLTLPVKVHDADLIASLPDHFDPREKWPGCPSLNEIRDQGSCGSCWAFGAVAAMTDRVCIHSNGTKNIYFSAQDTVSCCEFARGCEGTNDLGSAWYFWKNTGIVSGGPYNSSQGCRPYEIAPCQKFPTSGVNVNSLPPCHDYEKTPQCVKQCQSNYGKGYYEDKHRAKSIYMISGEDNIKAELFKNGPVETVFVVYFDFTLYQYGVYTHTYGEVCGSHAVKLMGWGVENGTKYWLVANSWNSGWGDQGYFKIQRGADDGCHFASEVVAGEPELD